MQINTLKLPGLLEIVPKRHGDDRGWFAEVFRATSFNAAAGSVSFVQENQSRSAQAGTLRGLHFQLSPMAQGKLVRVEAGAIIDIAIDLRKGSPTWGQWTAIELSEDKGNQLWLPRGFGHGFCTLTPNTLVCYKVDAYYSPLHDHGVAWDDPDIGVEWPAIADPETLSGKDRSQPRLVDLPADLFAEFSTKVDTSGD